MKIRHMEAQSKNSNDIVYKTGGDQKTDKRITEK